MPIIEEDHWTELQRRAEMLAGGVNKGVHQQEINEINRLINQIQVNQAELERQNAELSEIRDSAEASSRKYETLYRNFASLFNFTPIGYLIIDRDGVIHDINLAASILFDAPRSTLVGCGITDFIHRDDQDGFYYQKLDCQKHLKNSIFELKMKRTDGRLFDAQLQMQSFFEAHSDERRYTISIVDISEQVQLSSSFALQQNALELSCRATTMGGLLEGYVQLVKTYLQCDAVRICIRDDAGNIPCLAYHGFSRMFCESESPLSPSCRSVHVHRGDQRHHRSRPAVFYRKWIVFYQCNQSLSGHGVPGRTGSDPTGVPCPRLRIRRPDSHWHWRYDRRADPCCRPSGEPVPPPAG